MARLSSGYNKGSCRSSTAREKIEIYIAAVVKDRPAARSMYGRSITRTGHCFQKARAYLTRGEARQSFRDEAVGAGQDAGL
jgi:hypothetical protein